MSAQAVPVHPDDVRRHLREVADLSAREKVTVAHLADRLGPSGVAVLCIVLSVPFLQPVPTGPLATVCGLAFAALGRQIMRGEPVVRLPERVRAIEPGPRTWATVHRVVSWFLSVGSKIGRGRLAHWTHGRRGDVCIGGLVAVGGLLIAVPFLAVPLNNTFPALIVVCAAMARLHRDAIFLGFALFWLKVTLVYFAVVLWGVWFVGDLAVTRLG